MTAASKIHGAIAAARAARATPSRLRPRSISPSGRADAGANTSRYAMTPG
jgi:hypothetical protein